MFLEDALSIATLAPDFIFLPKVWVSLSITVMLRLYRRFLHLRNGVNIHFDSVES
jgi:hypothetical protein